MDTKKYTKWKNEPTLKALQQDFTMALPYHRLNVERLNRYNSVYLDAEADTYKVDVSGRSRSKYTSKTYKRLLKWITPNLEVPLITEDILFTVTPYTLVTQENIIENTRTLNHQWNTEVDKINLVQKASKKFAREGTAVLKVGWEYKVKQVPKTVTEPLYATTEEQVQSLLTKAKEISGEAYNKVLSAVQNGNKIQIGEQTKEIMQDVIVKNSPTITVKNNQDIMVDPKCKGVMKNAKFIIDIHQIDFADLVSNKNMYFNLKELKNSFSESFDSSVDTHFANADYLSSNPDLFAYDTTDFSDIPRKKLQVYEYWGYWDIDGNDTLKPIVATWCNDILIRLAENPYTHKKLPFVFGQFELLDEELWGEPNADAITDTQKSYNNTIRAMQDITAEKATGQEFVDESLFSDPIQMDNYRKGRTVRTKKGVDPSKAIFRKGVEPVPSTLFDMLHTYENEVYKITGIQEFNREPKAINSLTGELIQSDSVTNRETSVFQRFSNMFASAGNLILSMNKEFLLTSNIILDGNKPYPVDISKLEGEFNASINIDTPQIKDKKAHRIAFLMQTGQGVMPEEMILKYHRKLNQLWGLPDMVQYFDDMLNREPSEQEKRIRELENENIILENKRLKLENIRLASQVRLDTTKADVNESLADRENQFARKLEAQTKLFDQEFINIEDGTVRNIQKEDKEYQHLANLEREEVRTKREQKNIELKESKKLTKIEGNREEKLQYIKDSSVNNQSFDAIDDVYRNILEKNSYEYL